MRFVLTWLLLARAASADPIAEREQEAARLERTYAKTYAVDALVRASALRAALGQRAKWIANVEHAVRLHPTKAETAVLVFELAMTSPAHLRLYLRRFAELGGTDREVIAHAMLGEQLWQSSCGLASTIDGLCVRMLRAHFASCEPSRARWSLARRDTVLVRAATAELQAAVRVFELNPTQALTTRAAHANAKRLLADDALEKLIDRPLPKLNFTTRDAGKRSMGRFQSWIDAQTKQSAKVVREYEAVIALRAPHATIAAALRLGQRDRIFAAHLVTAALPHRLATGEFASEKRNAFCDQMREVTEPLSARAVDLVGTCASKARELDVDDAWAEACRRDLTILDPEAFPPFGEHVAKPGPLPR